MSDAEILALTANLGECVYKSFSIFDIEKKIGKGQFSVVYRARCRADSAVVAVKKVQIFEMMDAKARLDCMKEINLLQVCRPIVILQALNCTLTNWLLRNPEVYYRPYIGLPLVPIFSKMYPVSRITAHLPQIHLNIILPSTSWPP